MRKFLPFICSCFFISCLSSYSSLNKDPSNGPYTNLLLGSQESLIWPVLGSVSSKYGMRNKAFHSGIDIRAKKGSNIFAVQKGIVEFSGYIRGYGKTVILKHKDFRTLYAHCSALLVRDRQKIRQGQTIAKVGTTGKSTGPHLHFEYQDLEGRSINPEDMLP